MEDPFNSYPVQLDSPASRHFTITPGNSDLTQLPRMLYVQATGNLVMRDSAGTDVTYAVEVGQILPFRPRQVRTGTTATVIGWL
jgi:hypothetical protein